MEVVMTTTKKSAKTCAKKSTKNSVKVPALTLKAIAEDSLKMQDKRFLSVVIGQLALADRYELPLAVNRADDGQAVQSFGLVNVERSFYALHAKFSGKVKIHLEAREAQEGQFFVVVIEKTAKKTACKFTAEVKATDLKLEGSKTRAKKAKAKKADKKAELLEKREAELQDLAETAQKQATLATVTRDKRQKALEQKDGKKANELHALELAAAREALLANIKSVIIQCQPQLSKDDIETMAQKLLTIMK